MLMLTGHQPVTDKVLNAEREQIISSCSNVSEARIHTYIDIPDIHRNRENSKNYIFSFGGPRGFREPVNRLDSQVSFPRSQYYHALVTIQSILIGNWIY
jgi:hypothetical protein